MFLPDNDTTITTISTLIQLAVAPVFLIAGVAGLLNVFTGRLSRIVNRLEKIDKYADIEEEKNPDFKENAQQSKRRSFLLMRMENINRAIFFCTTTGLMVALVILTFFASALFSFNGEIFISIFFILAMFFLIISLMLFLSEIHFTTSYIKTKKLEEH